MNPPIFWLGRDKVGNHLVLSDFPLHWRPRGNCIAGAGTWHVTLPKPVAHACIDALRLAVGEQMPVRLAPVAGSHEVEEFFADEEAKG